MSTTGELLSWIRAATRAPSTHNTQPWLFEIDGERVTVRPDPARALPALDPHFRELWMSVGCAVENMVIAARHDGEALEVSRPPIHLPHRGVLVRARRDITAPDGLYHAIGERQTNRQLYDGRPLEREVVETLEALKLEPGVSLRLVTDRGAFDPYARLVDESDRQLFSHPRYRRELTAWMRFNEREAAATLDGMNAHTYAGHRHPAWLNRMLFPLTLSPSRRAREDVQHVGKASALLVLATQDDRPPAWIAAGQALQRVLLHLTLLGVQHAYLNEPVRLPVTRMKLAHLAGLHRERPQLLLRLGHALPLPRSSRRPLEEVVLVRRTPLVGEVETWMPGGSGRSDL